MYYQTFLTAIKDLIIEKWITVSWEDFEREELWQYIISCFCEHTTAIEHITMLGYIPKDCYLREILSGDYPIIQSNDLILFKKSYWSGKSDLIPVINFMNSDNNILTIEFAKAWFPF